MSFYSQYGEDRWIFENLALPEIGFYVDAGCYEPLDASNTQFLRVCGWKGIAIDGNPALAATWIKPKMVVALLSDRPTGRFEINANPGISRLREDSSAPERTCRTLNDVLRQEAAPRIDLLSVDLEGSEYDVVKGLDFELYQPAIIVAEYNTEGIGEDYRLRDFLVGLGYRVVHQTVANFIYTI